MKKPKLLIVLSVMVPLMLAACGGAPPTSPGEEGEPSSTADPAPQATLAPTVDAAAEIETILPKDAIPSIDNPRFYPIAEANAEYEDSEKVMGIEVDGEARAYSTALLSSHEIVNDEIKGRPLAVTW